MPKQVSHVIKSKNSDFRYHFLKGFMLSGSKISGKTHPIQEVNKLKKHLIVNQKLAKDGENYILRKNLYTGLLMAYNLYSDDLKKDLSDLNNTITLFKLRSEDKDIFKGEMVSTDNQIFKQMNLNCLKLNSIWRFTLDYGFIKGTDKNSFSESELFVANLLTKHGFLSKNIRHGDADVKECDIVDEERHVQVEVTFVFKTELENPKKSPYYDSERILTEFSDNRFIHPSKSLIKKMSNKYTTKYDTYLAILMIGTPESSLTLFSKLMDVLEKQGMKESPFNEYYLITFNPMNNVYTMISFKENKIIDDSETASFGFIKKARIDFSEIRNNEKCLYLLDNLFTNEKPIMILNVEEFESFANDLKVANFNK